MVRNHGVRTFARKFSNNDFFLKILPSKFDELVMPEMGKKNGGEESPTSFRRTCPEEHLNLSKSGFVREKTTVAASPKILQLEL